MHNFKLKRLFFFFIQHTAGSNPPFSKHVCTSWTKHVGGEYWKMPMKKCLKLVFHVTAIRRRDLCLQNDFLSYRRFARDVLHTLPKSYLPYWMWYNHQWLIGGLPRNCLLSLGKIGCKDGAASKNLLVIVLVVCRLPLLIVLLMEIANLSANTNHVLAEWGENVF